MIRWGLCCQFLDAPIRFRAATHRYVATLTAAARRDYLASIAAGNAAALAASIRQCQALGIGAFRGDGGGDADRRLGYRFDVITL